MSTSRLTLIQRGVRRIGGRTGIVSDGSLTTAVLGGLIGTTGDDSYYAGDRVIFLESTNGDVDAERLITGWDDSLGQATFDARLDDAVDQQYALVNREDYTLAEFRDALNEALRWGKRTYRYVLPVTPNLTLYSLSQLDWLEGGDDIDAVWLSTSPIMLHNEDFALWDNGPAAGPDGWTVTGANTLITRQATGIRSAYSARLTRVTTDATMYQSIPPQLLQFLTRSTNVVYYPWQVGAWVVSSTANVARVGLYNGSTTLWSPYHTGNGQPQWLIPSTQYTPTGVETDCRLVCQVANTDSYADFHAAVLMSGTQLPLQARDRGSQAFYEIETNYAVRNVGGTPEIELPYYPSQQGQMIVYSRRSFAELAAETDTVDDQYARELEAGMLVFLLVNSKPNQARDRIDAILKDERGIWTRALKKTADLPVPRIPRQALIMGA